MWRIRTLTLISTVLIFGSAPVFARGGGHSGGHGGGHSGGHGGHSGGHRGHHGGHTGDKHGRIQRAQRRGITSRIRILVPLVIRFQRIAPDLTRSSGRRIRLSGIPAKLARDSQCRKRIVLGSKPAACRYLLHST